VASGTEITPELERALLIVNDPDPFKLLIRGFALVDEMLDQAIGAALALAAGPSRFQPESSCTSPCFSTTW
jgi:hypothetical protein